MSKMFYAKTASFPTDKGRSCEYCRNKMHVLAGEFGGGHGYVCKFDHTFVVGMFVYKKDDLVYRTWDSCDCFEPIENICHTCSHFHRTSKIVLLADCDKDIISETCECHHRPQNHKCPAADWHSKYDVVD